MKNPVFKFLAEYPNGPITKILIREADNMTRYRKKPVIIEAEQFFENSVNGWPLGVFKDSSIKTGFGIETLEGTHEVTEGDYIITGVKGERYPCKPDIFDMTYSRLI